MVTLNTGVCFLDAHGSRQLTCGVVPAADISHTSECVITKSCCGQQCGLQLLTGKTQLLHNPAGADPSVCLLYCCHVQQRPTNCLVCVLHDLWWAATDALAMAGACHHAAVTWFPNCRCCCVLGAKMFHLKCCVTASTAHQSSPAFIAVEATALLRMPLCIICTSSASELTGTSVVFATVMPRKRSCCTCRLALPGCSKSRIRSQ